MTDPDVLDPNADPAVDPPADPAPDPDPVRTFSQTDLDRIVKDRLLRQKGQFADYDELKAKADKLAEIETANQTELERVQAEAETLRAEVQAANAARLETTYRSAVLKEAVKRNVIDPDDVVALLDREALTLDESGTPTNIAEAMEELLTAKPHLVAQAGARGNADQGARAGGANQLSRDALQSMTPAEIVAAHRDGRLETVKKGPS